MALAAGRMLARARCLCPSAAILVAVLAAVASLLLVLPIDSTPQAALPVSWMSQLSALSGKCPVDPLAACSTDQ